MNVYKLIVFNGYFCERYTIKANSLTEASKKAKNEFIKKTNDDINKLKVSIQIDDINNHLDEIMNSLYNSNVIKFGGES